MSSAARLAMMALAGLSAATTRAAVFEIADDGTFQTRAGTPDVRWTGRARDTDTPDAAIEAMPDMPADALTTVATPAVPIAYTDMLLAAARRYDVSPDLLAALVARESAWQVNALSVKGAIGLAQLMPATARALAVDPRNAAGNLDGAAHYLRKMLDLFDGDIERALAAYNAGPARVMKANGVPPIRETRLYVSTIIDRLAPPVPATTMGAVR